MLLISFILTYPYPFIQTKIPYQKNENNELNNFQNQCINSSIVKEMPLGCPKKFKWCSKTPQINMYLYLFSTAIGWGNFNF